MERRSHPRWRVCHPILYLSQIYPRPNSASTVDLSLGGAKIQSLYQLTTDRAVEMTISIRPQVIKCKGKVVHICESGQWKTEAGIQFQELSDGDRFYLSRYLTNLAQQPEPLPFPDIHRRS